MRREAKLTTIFRKWALQNFPHLFPNRTLAIEIKQCSTSVPFSALQEHQELTLWTAKHKYLFYKIPDMGLQNPCDVMYLSDTLSFVVVFYTKADITVFIDIDVWQKEKTLSKRKSLSCKRAIEIASQTVRLSEIRQNRLHQE